MWSPSIETNQGLSTVPGTPGRVAVITFPPCAPFRFRSEKSYVVVVPFNVVRMLLNSVLSCPSPAVPPPTPSDVSSIKSSIFVSVTLFAYAANVVLFNLEASSSGPSASE